MRSTERDRPFGRLLTAMVTPFAPDLSLDLPAAAALARHLVDDQGNDGIVVSGTTGESPTTSDEEKAALLRTVVSAVGDRAHVVAGVGTFDTAHTIDLAQQAADLGADGLLVVTPYYNKPPQAGLVRHFTAVADATDLPVLLYDIPHRSGIPIAEESLLELATHDRIVGVKDAKGNLVSSARVMALCAERGDQFAYYAGDDPAILALLSVGAVGLVGTSTAFTGALTAQLIAAHEQGDLTTARELYRRLLPVYTGIFVTQGCIMVKAGLALQGRPVGGVRAPLVEATEVEVAGLATSLAAAGLS
ncbi:MAG TPA: 4-hydroxy-tetrahydrodipicolinate synthase [Candidatus Avipropionibacterium avicola]|uniref:4-hydroxy-tetrahydrodipicolinate synthase n=1 Tax=Candidatus Avipropionibacterium avicola TaxID=2840701 RepID=A0A9D1GX02_9ACTN|nr:4-hydroxy-tetrahydrodipicolinate synthase [Candidatus Avipropionibacterium avicola]